MLHVILLILKILGIILLSILLLVILLLCAVLFVPVTYQVRAGKDENIHLHAMVGWMFRMISVHYETDQAGGWKQDLQIRLFGIPILRPLEEKKPKKTKRKKKQEKERPKQKSPEPEPKESESPKALVLLEEREEAHSQVEPERLPSALEKLQMFFFRVRYAIWSICGRIRRQLADLRVRLRELLEKKDKLLDFWNREEHRRARSAIWKEVRYLWKKARPKRIEGNVRFGFDDPSTTGMCMGALSVLYVWYPERFQPVPDFDREILEGKIWIKGHIRLYVAGLILWRVWFNKDIRQMYEHWQELE